MTDSNPLMGSISSRSLPAPAAYALLSLICLSVFRVFANLPLDTLHQVFSLLAIVVFSGFYLFRLTVNSFKGKLSRFDLLVCLYLTVNFFTAFRALSVFGQPLLYGLAAQRSVLLVLGGLLVVDLLKNGLVTVEQLRKTLFWLGMLLLFVSFFFVLFVDPKRFGDAEFVVYSPIRGYRFRFQFAPVILLFFSSLTGLRGKRRLLNYSVIIAILAYLLFFLQSRTTLAVLFFTMIVYLRREFDFARRFKYVFLLVGGTAICIALALATGMTAFFDRYTILYTNAIEAIRGGSPEEASAAIRFLELKTSMTYIIKHPLFGNGFISNQWHGGWQGLLGYFYPTDIGIFGNIFVFGLLGTLVIYLPFLYAWRIMRQSGSTDSFTKACGYALLFFFFGSFFSAMNIRDAGTILFMVSILHYFRHSNPSIASALSDSHENA